MNTELIQLSRKAAKEFSTDADGYSQASQLINALCDELEATAPAEPLEPKAQAYRSIAKRIFEAHPKYQRTDKVTLILANDIREAEKLAMLTLDTSSVFVQRLCSTKDPQVYEVP